MSVRAWLSERLPVADVLAALRHKTVPHHRYSIWYYFGGATLFLWALGGLVVGIIGSAMAVRRLSMRAQRLAFLVAALLTAVMLLWIGSPPQPTPQSSTATQHRRSQPALTPRQQAQARDLSLQPAASQAAPDARRATTLAGSRQGPGGSDC